ncbi:MAG: hypothetical protein NUV57_01635 [archaeon]|nr:hypothetical protein [archaeon]
MNYVKEFEKKFSGKTFTTRDVKIFLENKGANKNYYSLFIANEIKKEKIFRLKNGVYSTNQNLDESEKAFFPSYHGLQEALTIHGFWGQETVPVIITPRKIRNGERKIFNSKILARRIGRKMFFGYETKKYHGAWITVSDPEKTLIDFAYYNEPIGKETLEEMKAIIDKKKLEKYLKQTNKRTKTKTEKLLVL